MNAFHSRPGVKGSLELQGNQEIRPPGPLNCAVASPDGTRVAAVGSRPEVTILDASQGFAYQSGSPGGAGTNRIPFPSQSTQERCKSMSLGRAPLGSEPSSIPLFHDTPTHVVC